jgi:hypothetical protein
MQRLHEVISTWAVGEPLAEDGHDGLEVRGTALEVPLGALSECEGPRVLATKPHYARGCQRT